MVNEIIVPLFAGLALFLFGMKTMEWALNFWAAPYLKQILLRLTRTPWRGLLTGTGTTAVLQSSSAVTVITIGFVNAQILTFPQTLGIILGTNIGSCITTELIGLEINHLALPTLFVSSAVWFMTWLIPFDLGANSRFTRWRTAMRCLSLSVAGFSCVLLGMIVMETIVPALQSRGLFIWFLEQSKISLLWGIAAGACITAIIQSSAATIAITMGLASVQAISLELGIAIVLGANIGTCLTAFIASIGGSRSGQFVAWAHIALNIGGAFLFYPLITYLGDVSELLAPQPSGQIAHAQTIYNIVCSLIALPICYLPIFKLKQPNPPTVQ